MADTEKTSRDAQYAEAKIITPDSLSEKIVPHNVPSFDKAAEAKLMLKIDLHLLPSLCLMFLLAFLDKINIANAQVYGLSKDLNLNGATQYNTALVVFYLPYIVLEIPSNLFLKKLTPHVWLSASMFLFGICTMSQGFTTNFGGIVTARFFLGICETPVFPGAYYIISFWYSRFESQRRFTFFYCSITLAGAFGGLLAAAIGKMDGLRGLQGWRWIFIIEGIATSLLAILLFFTLPDFPETARWLTSSERAFIKAKLAADQGPSTHDRPISAREALQVFRDPKVWVASLMYFAALVPGYSYSYFAPTIIQEFGFSPVKTQLWSVPPWAATFAWCMLLATLSDMARRRGIFIFLSLVLTLVGTAVLLAVGGHKPHPVHLQYGMLFLFVMGLYGAIPIMTCWLAMNLGGHTRRAVGGAAQIAFGQVGAIVAVYTFLKADAPRYVPGYSICLAFTALALVLAGIYALMCWRENGKREREMSRGDVLGGREDEGLGDLAVGYRYML